jgi:hypothetical protein
MRKCSFQILEKEKQNKLKEYNKENNKEYKLTNYKTYKREIKTRQKAKIVALR